MNIPRSKLGNAACAVAKHCAALIRRETTTPERRKRAREKAPLGALPRGYQPLLDDKPATPKSKAPDDETRRLDVRSERAALTLLARYLSALGYCFFIVVTEESGVLLWGSHDEYLNAGNVLIVFLDPVDSTHQALLRFGGCAVVLLAEAVANGAGAARSLRNPAILATAIATPGGETFWAERGIDGAFVDFGAQRLRLAPDSSVGVESAILSAVVYKPSRIVQFFNRLEWLELLGSRSMVITHHGGPLPIAKVAAGEIHLVWDSVKGYAVSDLSPGMFIAAKAGCFCWADAPGWSPFEIPLPRGGSICGQLNAALKDRYKFACSSANPSLDAFYARHLAPAPAGGPSARAAAG
jgi:fructose-1,6-bisphosphatase/inositol monophosphatase family enzyme